MKELPNKYNHKDAEKRWQEYWEEHNIFTWNPDEPREANFVIDTPPPTVSGVLHMGHIFSYTQADFVARFQRMTGKNVFYPMGFDDNGLPTERLVEKVKKIRAADLPREEFIKLCQEVTIEAEEQFCNLFRSTALSVDWSQEYQTISEESRKISQLSFLDLYHKGHAYRKLQPMLWDPVDQTAIAQAEIEDKELDSHENYLIFGLDDGTGERVGEFQVMTTRPELLPACVAVMCDPKDAKKYENMLAIRPISGMRVPIIPDDKVDASKGTGMVMCCTFGDETDIYWYNTYKESHNLPLRVILNKYGKFDAKLLDTALGTNPNKEKIIELLAGKTIKKAREEIFIDALENDRSLAKREPIKHMVKCAERSGAALEIIPTDQWFIRIMDKKEALKDKAAECQWYPEYMRIRIEQWIDGLSWDWCISRQRYSGVPFPVWYSKRKGEEGKILLARPEDLPVNPLVDLPEGYSSDEVDPDLDIMDTWATSSVSPQLNSKAITDEYGIDNDRHSKLFPADLRPQAHEIIRTWAFYTIVKAYLHQDTIPWKNLMISGWCLAPDKTKMSKSKGNVITPVGLIEEQSADAVRFWASTSKLGTDTAFSDDVLKIGKKLVTKLWNASKFVATHLENIDGIPTTPENDVNTGIITEILDQWVIGQLHVAIEKATVEFEKYEYSNARAAAENFFWNDFCDNYLEIVKTRAYGEQGSTKTQQQSAIYTLYHVLDGILRLFAPFIPHITEELYSHIFDDKHKQIGSIHARGQWLNHEDYPLNNNAQKAGIFVREILDVVRKVKAENDVSLKWPLDSLEIAVTEDYLKALTETEADISNAEDVKHKAKKDMDKCFIDLANVTNAKSITWSDSPSSNSIPTENNHFMIAATLAKESDAA